uniref:sensor histidine kinase n=1 Tax=Roseivirga sp. TaxID=1964215 RepID=UPI004047D521
MNHLDQIKLQEVASKIQVVIFDTDGILVESCNTLFKVEQDANLFDQFIFLESLAEVFVSMEKGSGHDFPEVEWTEQVNALFNLSFRKVTEDRIQWVIFDKTADYDRLLGIQQSRNESAINEEVALLQKRVAEMENRLLEFRNLELKRIQDFKNEFFAQVSHEMRTPLSSIAGLVSLIEANQQKLTTYLPAIRSTSLHLNSIVNDILDISKIEAGKLTFECIDFSLHEEVSNVISGFQFEAQQIETQLELELPSEPIVLKSDPTRLKQVLYNLVGNSLKFTKKGKVALQIALRELDRDKVKLHFGLTDSGVGMTPAQMRKVLEPYAQAQDSTAREFGGTGLGLGIAIKLIEAFGGQLEIKSELGVGTAMSFELSFALGHLEHQPIQYQAELNGLKILLADSCLFVCTSFN